MTGPPSICSVTDVALRVTHCNSTWVGALHTTGGAGPVSETICTPDRTEVVVDTGRVVEPSAAADVDVVSGRAGWLAEHAVSPTIATIAHQRTTRDGRMTRS